LLVELTVTVTLSMAMSRDSFCGIFGGTFDPLHHGHITPVIAAARVAGLAKVVYIPAGAPPHRPRPQASAAHRLAMVKLALAEVDAGDVELTVDDIELNRRGHSYTIDTVQELQRRAPRTNYVLLLGLDALLGFESWHRWNELQRAIHIIGIARPGWRAPASPPAWWREAQVNTAAELRDARAGKILILKTAGVDISATKVRAWLRAGDADGYRDCLPSGVVDYIREHNLYAD